MKTRRLHIEQLDQKLKPVFTLENIAVPSVGWIKTIRTTLGISLAQLGKKLNINRSSIARMEQRESNGGITIKSMQEVGRAMRMKFVYGFIPMDGSIEKLIEHKAKELATEIVMRTSGSMILEDQENSKERIHKAISERTKEIVTEMPKKLWD